MQIILNSEITIKRSTRDDWDYILELRNNTRQFYENTNILTKDEHYAYLEKANVTIWIAYYGNEKIGFLKLNDYDLAIVLDEKFRNKGYGKIILKLGLDTAEQDRFTAIIKKDNIPSIRLYTGLGYVKTGEKDNMILFEYERNMKQ